jgi:hypothetical protein
VGQAEGVNPKEAGLVQPHEAGKPGEVASEATSTSNGTSSSLYEDPGTALKDLVESYHYWGEKLTDSSFALSLAVIGANWAAFGSIDQIRGNIWSELSIASILLSLAINLIGMKWLAEAHRKQIEYAEQDAARWKTEFDDAENKSCPWPSTAKIDTLAQRLRRCRTYFPLIGGALFIVALIFSQPKSTAASIEAVTKEWGTKLDSISDSLKKIDGKLANLNPIAASSPSPTVTPAASVASPSASPTPLLTPAVIPTTAPSVTPALRRVQPTQSSSKRPRGRRIRSLQPGSPTSY